MKAWTPKRQEGKWRNFLTTDEQVTVAILEGESEELKKRLANVTGNLNPIRQRAAQRALAAERSGEK